jgi:hypothetical protein
MNLFLRFSIALATLAWADMNPARAEPLPEDQVKSAYVLNFIKFVEWPADTSRDNGRLTLCLVGSAPLGGALGALNGRRAAGRELHVVQHASADDLSGCKVLFIGESEQRRFTAIIRSLGNSPVLTISDIDNFAERGGVIGLLNLKNKIVFEVNLAAARAGSLHIPGQMLNLAVNVFGK